MNWILYPVTAVAIAATIFGAWFLNASYVFAHFDGIAFISAYSGDHLASLHLDNAEHTDPGETDMSFNASGASIAAFGAHADTLGYLAASFKANPSMRTPAEQNA